MDGSCAYLELLIKGRSSGLSGIRGTKLQEKRQAQQCANSPEWKSNESELLQRPPTEKGRQRQRETKTREYGELAGALITKPNMLFIHDSLVGVDSTRLLSSRCVGETPWRSGSDNKKRAPKRWMQCHIT